ncbi:MAG: PKD domain-containing protein [Solirubrobacterales bacterium]|nr:PKD domain-containing protein [Solirubrobacterales bacterium]
MNERLRRHGRLIAGSLILLLAAAVGYALRPGGSAHAQPARAVVHPQAIAPVLAPASQRWAPGLRTAVAASVSRRQAGAHTTRSATARAGVSRAAVSTTRTGISTPPPSPGAVALALGQATGLSPSQVTSRPVCSRAAPGHASCAAQTLVLRSTGAPVRPRVISSSGHARPAAGVSANPPTPGTPAYLQQAYDLSSLSQSGGANDTVAVVDAYDDPTAEADLAVYRSTYGLSACTSANGCFQKVGQAGTSSLPAPNASWDQEVALDLDAVSAICPNCHILLVEANSSGFTDLQAAMWTAAKLGAKQISASWGGVSNGVPSVLRTFSGVATVAATGDYGYLGTGQDQYPAALPGVTAAGGTSLAPATTTSARGFGEAAWSWDGVTGGGSGCDLQFSRPSYQPASGCAGRAYADLSADADPNTGIAVYNSGSWSVAGGTSLSTPLIAAYYAVTGVSAATPQWGYGASGSLNDLVSGSSGNCAAAISYICNAGPGYDGPTGVGSISGSVVAGAPGIGGPAISGGVGSYTQSVSAHAATIAGGIYRNALDTNWWVQYGTTTAYGSQTSPIDVGAGGAPVPVTGYLSKLSPGTTYHYRLVAENSTGTTYGYDYTFTTPPASSSVPTAAFTATPTASTPGATVSFNAAASAPGTGGPITNYSWNFGDGNTGSGATATHSYALRGTFTVTLTVTSGGQTDTSRQVVTVDNPPSPAFTASSPVSAPTTMSFDGSHSAPGAGGSIIDYNWDFGDGSITDTGTSPNATHTYAKPGNYTVTLITTDDLDVTAKITKVIAAGAISATPTIPAPGGQVTLDASNATVPTGSITDYSWSFDGGPALDTGTSPTTPPQTFARGQHTVTLTLTANNGQTYTSTETITADNPPSVSALPASPTTAAPGQLVSFAGSGTVPAPGTIASYTWRFGDSSGPTTGTTAASSHIYDTPGKYTATLTVTDDLGVSASASQQVIVDQPTAAFSTGSSTVAPNATAGFNASASSDALSTPLQYSWNFGDGVTQTTGTTASATHSYATRGHYQVQLTVTNQYGQSDTSVQTVTVDTPPTAAFAPTASTITAGAPVSFDASGSQATAGGSITLYSWSFGDGSTGATTTSSAAHTFGAAGTYAVTLTATDDLGLTATVARQIVVAAPPAPAGGSGSPAPPAPAPAPAPVPTPAPTPVQPAPTPLTAGLGGGGKQRYATVLAHGMRLRLTLNQAARAAFQITIPASQTRLARGAKPKPGATVVLGRGAWNLSAGAHTITLNLPRAVAARLITSRPVVLTVRVTVTGAGGVLTRTVKLTLTR